MKNNFLVILLLFFLSSTFKINAQENQKVELIVQTGHSYQVQSASFSPNGKWLASSGSDGTLKFWSVESGRQLKSLEGHADSVESVTFSPNGKILASGSWDGTIKLWDVESGKIINSLTGHSGKVHSVTFSSDGKMLVSGSDDTTIKLWRVDSGQQIKSLIGHKGSVLSVAFSPDGKSLASSGWDNAIRLWNVETGEQIKSFENGHFSLEILSVSFSPDGKTLASGGRDGIINLWDVKSGIIANSLRGLSNSVRSVSFSSDRKTLAAGDNNGTLNLWNIENGNIINSFTAHSNSISSVSFAPDGKTLASGSLDNSIKIWNSENQTLIKSLESHANLVSSIAISPDGKLLANGSWNKPLKLWDLNSGKLINSLSVRPTRRRLSQPVVFQSLAFSADGKILANSSSDSKINLWDISNGQQLKSLIGHPDYSVWAAAFSPNGKILASGGSDSTIKLWDYQTGQLIKTLKSHSDWVLSVAFSPDGKYLASGSRDNRIKIWNVETGELIRSFNGHSSWVRCVAFSPDGKILASGGEDNLVKLWNFETGRLVESFNGHTDLISSVAFSPDGKTLASGSWDKTIRLWDVQSRKLINSIAGHGSAVWSLTFSPTGSFLFSGSTDATIKIWGTENNQLLATLITVDESEWIVTTPEGRFDTNKSLDNIAGLHWIINDQILNPLPLDVFMRQYYEPGLLQKILKCSEKDNCEREFKPLPSIADINRVQPKVTIKKINSVKNAADFADVTVEVESKTEEVSCRTADRINKKKLTSGAFDLRLFRDGQLVGSSTPKNKLASFIKNAPDLVRQNKEYFKKTGKLTNTPEDAKWREANDIFTLADENNIKRISPEKIEYTFRNIRLSKDGRETSEFTAYTFNSDKVKSATTTPFEFVIPKAIAANRKMGRAFVISIGVNASENPVYKLRYAANDARKVQETVGEKLKAETDKYSEVIRISLISDYDDNGNLTENTAQKAIIKAVFSLLEGSGLKDISAEIAGDNPGLEEVFKKIPHIEKIKAVEPEDTLIITYAGHGYADQSGIFYLLPYGIGRDTKQLTNDVLLKTISSDEISLWMQNITAAEMIMIIDACHSSAAVQGDGFKPGPMGSRGLGQLAYDKDMKILSATQADNVALELGSLQQGLLTYALLEDGIVKSFADADKDNKLLSSEWLAYAEKRVPELYGEINDGKRNIVIKDKNIKSDAVRSDKEYLDGTVSNSNISLQQPSLFDFKRRNSENTLFALK